MHSRPQPSSNARYRNGCCSPRDPCRAHREIALKYRRKRKAYVLGDERSEELARLAEHRFGDALPDSAEGRLFLLVMAHHIGEPNRVRAYLDDAAPWLDEDEADKLVKGIAKKRYRWNADTLASKEWLTVSYEERQALGLKTIGAFDMPRPERIKLRRERYRARKRQLDRAGQEHRRRAKGVQPRAQYEAESLSRKKPWEAEGLSRAQWYRKRETNVSRTYTSSKRSRQTCLKGPSKRLPRHKGGRAKQKRRLAAIKHRIVSATGLAAGRGGGLAVAAEVIPLAAVVTASPAFSTEARA